MNERSFAVVTGYLPEIDDSYKAAVNAGLNKRLAVALNTYRAAQGSMFYDNKLFFAVLSVVAPLIGCDHLVIQATGHSPRLIPAAALTADDLVFGTEQDPFDHIDMQQHGRITGMIRFENYMTIGGPPPYHDTCTFSFYSDKINTDGVVQQLQRMANEQQFLFTKVITGEEKPHISVLSRLKRLL